MATATMRDPCQSRHMIKTYVNWCMECEKELCHECTKYHPALKTMKNHHVVAKEYHVVLSLQKS